MILFTSADGNKAALTEGGKYPRLYSAIIYKNMYIFAQKEGVFEWKVNKFSDIPQRLQKIAVNLTGHVFSLCYVNFDGLFFKLYHLICTVYGASIITKD